MIEIRCVVTSVDEQPRRQDAAVEDEMSGRNSIVCRWMRAFGSVVGLSIGGRRHPRLEELEDRRDEGEHADPDADADQGDRRSTWGWPASMPPKNGMIVLRHGIGVPCRVEASTGGQVTLKNWCAGDGQHRGGS